MQTQNFRQSLKAFLTRAGLDQGELAERLDVDGSTVSRWLSKRRPVTPRRQMIRRIRVALNLDDHEYVSLVQVAYPDPGPTTVEEMAPVSPEAVDTSIRAADGVLYLHRYSKDNFPSDWSRVCIDYEKRVPGTMYTLFNTIPSVVRLQKFYEQYSEQKVYERSRVRHYLLQLDERKREFQDRLDKSNVRHIYHRRSIVELIASERWRQVKISPDLWDEQMADIPRMLDSFANFEIGLSDSPIPFHATVIGHRVALIEMLHHENLTPVATVLGFETTKAEVILAIQEQFDSLWATAAVEKNRAAVKAWFSGEWREDARKLRDDLDRVLARNGG